MYKLTSIPPSVKTQWGKFIHTQREPHTQKAGAIIARPGFGNDCARFLDYGAAKDAVAALSVHFRLCVLANHGPPLIARRGRLKVMALNAQGMQRGAFEQRKIGGVAAV